MGGMPHYRLVAGGCRPEATGRSSRRSLPAVRATVSQDAGRTAQTLVWIECDDMQRAALRGACRGPWWQYVPEN